MRRFRPRPECAYLAFNKPFQVLSQFTKPDDSEKATLADFSFPKGVYPVGRLDYDSEGLLILSDDGTLTDELLPPERRHGKTYVAQVEHVPSAASLAELAGGVVIDGQRTLKAKVSLLAEEPLLPARPVPIRYRQNIPTAWVSVTITEGRNRQVRRMTASVGHPTLRLVRTAIGRLHLADLSLAPGQWRRLSAEEVLFLFDDPER